MSTITTKHGLIKPELTDPADITQLNENWDKIDEKLSNIPITSDVPSDADMWIDPDDETEVITPEKIGAAPAGYGFGDRMTYIDMTSATYSGMTFEEALETVLATMPGYSCAQVQLYDPTNGYHANKFIGKLWKYTANYVTLEAINYSGYKAIMRKTGGTWQPWEWENPPMETNKEHRTTKRHKGKVVYTQLVDLGTLPASGQRSSVYSPNKQTTPVSFKAFVVPSSGNVNDMPFFTTAGELKCKAYDTGMSVVTVVFSDCSAYTGYAIVEYTKD